MEKIGQSGERRCEIGQTVVKSWNCGARRGEIQWTVVKSWNCGESRCEIRSRGEKHRLNGEDASVLNWTMTQEDETLELFRQLESPEASYKQ